MYKMSRILVPVDLSEGSLNALDTAVSLAKKHRASLHVLYVDESSFQTMEDMGTPYYSNLVNAGDVITALVGAIEDKHDIKPVVSMQEGNVAECIVKSSFLMHADLVVMGAHGASGYRDGFVGNNTYNVIKYAACPVLSVPQRKKVNMFKNILYPIRPMAGALDSYEIVSHFTSPATVMEVMGLSYRTIQNAAGTVLDTIIAEIKNQLKIDAVMAKPFWSEGTSIAEEILRYSNSASDLVVVTSGLDVTSKPKYVGPHAQKIIHCSRVPVLSIKKNTVPSFV
ncbi:MAG: universal stress protein [Flavisolibacter sp.]